MSSDAHYIMLGNIYLRGIVYRLKGEKNQLIVSFVLMTIWVCVVPRWFPEVPDWATCLLFLSFSMFLLTRWESPNIDDKREEGDEDVGT